MHLVRRKAKIRGIIVLVHVNRFPAVLRGVDVLDLRIEKLSGRGRICAIDGGIIGCGEGIPFTIGRVVVAVLVERRALFSEHLVMNRLVDMFGLA